MSQKKDNLLIAAFGTPTAAEAAVKELQMSGFQIMATSGGDGVRRDAHMCA